MAKTLVAAAIAAVGLAVAPAFAQDAFRTTVPRQIPAGPPSAIQVDGSAVSLVYGSGEGRRVVRVAPAGNQVEVSVNTAEAMGMRLDPRMGRMVRFGPNTEVMLFGNFEFNMNQGGVN